MNTALFLLTLACDVPDTAPTIAPTAAAPVAEVDAWREEAERSAYSYSPLGKRDPFRSFVAAGPSPGLLPGAYRLLGLVWGDEAPHALIADAAGNSFVVVEGNLLGESWGRVARISGDGVEVVTEYFSPFGDIIREMTVLRLDRG
ncbi:MAG: type IV pilus assembly protein PilP [Myxococcota bacterium]|jgi:type IV pilus assembly protein PilP